MFRKSAANESSARPACSIVTRILPIARIVPMARTRRILVGGLMAVVAIGSTGCQMDVGGQTLPSPYYVGDDVQYFPPGAEFKLAREAAAMNAFQADD